MDLTANLFTALLELQGWIQLYSSLLKINTSSNYRTFGNVLTEKFYDNSIKKMEEYLVNIQLKAVYLGLDEKLEGILDNKIPLIKKLKNYPPYEEFLRTNHTPIMKIFFRVPSKRSCKDAFGRNYCEIKGNYYI